MPAPDEPDRAWCLAGSGVNLVVGPARALGDRTDVRVEVFVDVARPADALGSAVKEVRVAESGLREFTVTWHDLGDGATVAVNPAGGNQVGWSEPARDAFWFTVGQDPLSTSVYQRFLLRHLATVLLEHDLGGRSIHAVTAEWSRGVLAVAGPTCSGKTRLMNRLVGAGLVGPLVDDDCPIIAPAGAAATLVPRRYEVEAARTPDLAGVIVLSDAVTTPRLIPAARAHELLGGIPVPWPASWLPADPRPELPPLRPDLVALEVPAQDEGVFDEVASIVASGFSSSG